MRCKSEASRRVQLKTQARMAEASIPSFGIFYTKTEPES